MTRLAVQFLDQGLHRAMFDAMPMPVFLVDADASILEYNAAAGQFLGPKKQTFLRRRFGDVLRCLHATESPDGCGSSPSCPKCVVRTSVQAASRGQRVVRRRATLERLIDHKRTTVSLRVGCHPFTYEGHAFNLLVVEGLND
jgi:PAS domain-containing protein